MNDTSQAEFQKWYSAEYFDGSEDRRNAFRSASVEEIAFNAWQAARAQTGRVALSDAEILEAWGEYCSEICANPLPFARAILAAQADAGIPASNITPQQNDEPSASVCAYCGSHQAITQPLIAEAARDDVAESCQKIDAAFTHRLAIMLECMLIDPNGSWNESASLLDEYRAAWDAINPPPPTFMGEPMPPDRRLRLMRELERRAAIAASTKVAQ